MSGGSRRSGFGLTEKSRRSSGLGLTGRSWWRSG